MIAEKPRVTLDEMIAEAGREIGLRRNVYPTFVARQKMSQDDADEHMRRMQAIVDTLNWLKANRRAVIELASR